MTQFYALNNEQAKRKRISSLTMKIYKVLQNEQKCSSVGELLLLNSPVSILKF